MPQSELPRAQPATQIRRVSIDSIEMNPDQPRSRIDDQLLEELANSIRLKGVIQPVVLREISGGYQLVAGHRRFLACKRAGMTTIPALVRSMNESEAAEIALVENIQREDLNAVDEALAYKALMFKHGLSTEEVAERVGKDRSTIANSLRILSLPKQILDSVSRETISEGHARVLVGIEDRNLQMGLWKRIVEEGISVRQTEDLARSMRKARRRAHRARTKDPNLVAMEERLQKVFATKVRVAGTDKRGRIEIEYYSKSELERLLDLMVAIELRG